MALDSSGARRNPRRRSRKTALGTAAALILSLTGTAVLNIGWANATTLSGVFELDGNPEASSADGDDWSLLQDSDPTNDSADSKTDIPIFDGADAPTDKTYFKGGGSKDQRDIDQWAYSGTDSAPDKDEIVNAAAAAYIVPDQTAPGGDADSDPDQIIVFHADRFSNDGDAAIGFWFFKNRISLGAGGKFNGTHANGDVLVISDFNEGESINIVKVFEWQSGALVEKQLPGTGGRDCQDTLHNPFVCATENRIGNVPSVWDYAPKPNLGDAGQYPAFTFLEGAINTSAVVPRTDQCFASFLAETRSTTSVSGQLKDFVIGEFPICAPTTDLDASPSADEPEVVVAGDSVNVTFTENNDGDVDLTDVSVSVDPASEALCDLSPDSVDLNAGDSQDFTCTVHTPSEAQVIEITGIGTGTSPIGEVTFCEDENNPPPGVICDEEERAVAKIVTIVPGTDLFVSAGPTQAKAGDTITYTIQETNDGTAPVGYESALALEDVAVTAFAGAGATQAQADACNAQLALGYTPTGGDADDLLEPGETFTFACEVTAGSDDFTLGFAGTGTVLKGTAHAREVTIFGNCENTPGTSETVGVFCDLEEFDSDSVNVVHPSTELTVSADAVITYTFKEKNDGDVALTSPTVTAPAAASTALCNVEAVAYSSGDSDTNSILDVGETWTFTCKGSLTGPTDDTGSSSVTMVGVGNGTDPTGDPVTFPEHSSERDRVQVTIDNLPRGADPDNS